MRPLLVLLLLTATADAGITNYRTSRSRTPIYAASCQPGNCPAAVAERSTVTVDEAQLLPFRRPKPTPSVPPVNPADPPKFDFADDDEPVAEANSDVVLDGIKTLLENGDSGTLHTLMLIVLFFLTFRKGKTATVKGVVDTYIDAKKQLARAQKETDGPV